MEAKAMKKKIGTKLMITLLVMAAGFMLSEVAFAADAVPEGQGTQDNPYKITTYAELLAFAKIANGTHDSISKNNIDLYTNEKI